MRVRENPPATKDTAHTNFLDVCVKLVRGMVVVIAAEEVGGHGPLRWDVRH